MVQTWITYGIVGVGMMGIEHIRNIIHMENATITCIADSDGKSIASCVSMLRSEYGDMCEKVKVFTNAKLLFESNLCQIAVIATPNHTHRDIVLEAYKYGNNKLHVLMEKPLCTTIEDCREVIKAAENRDGRTYVGLEYCYMPPIARVIRDTHGGVIGSPRMVSIREHRFPFLVKVRNWNRFNRNSGGTFVEKCCHFFDLFNRILRPHVPVTVYASGAQDVNHLDEVYDGERADVFDNGYVVIEYSEGRRACLDLCMFAEASHSQEEVCIVGSKGKLEAFLPQSEVRTGIRGLHQCNDVQRVTVDDGRIKYRGHHYGSSYLEHLDIQAQLFRSFDNDGSECATMAGLWQGFLSVAIGVAAHVSIEEKRVVYLKELVNSDEMQRYVDSFHNIHLM